jgi:hypothetical protein
MRTKNLLHISDNENVLQFSHGNKYLLLQIDFQRNDLDYNKKNNKSTTEIKYKNQIKKKI